MIQYIVEKHNTLNKDIKPTKHTLPPVQSLAKENPAVPCALPAYRTNHEAPDFVGGFVKREEDGRVYETRGGGGCRC